VRRRKDQAQRDPLSLQRPQPVINPLALEPEPEGRQKQVLETSHTRLMLGAGLFCVAFVVIAARLAMVTLLPGDDDAAPPVAKVAVAGRADIIDRNGVVLATSLSTASLYANPKQITEPETVAKQLNAILPDLNPAATTAKLSSERGFIWLWRNLTPKQQQAVNDLGVPGLYFQYETKRIYPQGNLTSHLVGFTDIDGKGIAGVERSFDDALIGGHQPLQLSIDIRVQHILHSALTSAISDFHAIGGAGIVMDVQSGEVLSLISLPDFDPSDPGAATPDARFNRATLGVFEMGSTFKTFNTAIGLDTKTVTLQGGYDATNPIKIGGFTINDYHGKHRFLTVPEIYAYSSNIGSAKMADAFGTEVQQTYLRRFGMLEKSPIELPEVGEPMFPSIKNWRRINTMTVAYGHGIAVNVAQLIAGISAVVNGGTMRAPTILKRDPSQVPPGQQVISTDTSSEMRELMRTVVQVGTAKKADAEGYLVGCKTGTADKQEGHGYAKNARMAVIVCAFPMSAPRYALAALVDEPVPNAHSYGYATAGWVAAPVAGALISQMAPLYAMGPIPDDAPEAQNPLAALVADYDSPNSEKKTHSLVTQVKATASGAPSANQSKTPLDDQMDATRPSATPEPGASVADE
jgi:cell division protein FtsI (penicillin-binding protein 3)